MLSMAPCADVGIEHPEHPAAFGGPGMGGGNDQTKSPKSLDSSCVQHMKNHPFHHHAQDYSWMAVNKLPTCMVNGEFSVTSLAMELGEA